MIASPRATYCRVPSLACVIARGDDAEDFLRRQLSQNPPQDETRFAPAAWNDGKGRVRAMFDIVRLPAGLLLVAEREGLDAVLAKLRMFVLRSRVELDVDDRLAVAAVAGDVDASLGALGIAVGAEPFAACRAGALLALRLGPRLTRIVGPEKELARIEERLEPGRPEDVEIAEIRLGLPRVAGLAERYVPQMLNLDRLGAVSFTKGCYPGQEIVARLHHRGTAKRRLCRFVGQAARAPAPGTPLVGAGGEAVGEVVRAAAADGQLELLAVVSLDAAGGVLRLGDADGTRLERAPIPQDAP